MSITPKYEVIKSPNDTREYKTLILPNQLEVLVISDPDSEQAAVSLDIATGQINDPHSRQGLAHFLEHMLFLGNKKYPEPEEFGSYLAAHGGYSNAYTAFEDTNFFFAIQDEYLEGAIDRFVQFFISPSFDFAFVEREINAVNSEHTKNIQDDSRRIYRILKETSNPAHPYHQFATGNLESLKGNDPDYTLLRKELIKYFDENYSANRMKLVVVGKDSVAQLERMVVDHFSKIQDKGLKTKSYQSIPIIADALPRKIVIEPVKAMRQLRLSFPIPSYRKFYRHKPGSVVSQLIGDEGKGSILSYLRKRGWATTLSAGIGYGTKEESFFDIELSLTPAGLNHTDEIIGTIFQYIELIKREEKLGNYYAELKQMAEIGFRFKEMEDPVDYARTLSATMQEVPGFDAVVSNWLYEAYRPELVKELLGYLTAENLQIVIVAAEVKTDRTEKWYGTRYAVEPIAREVQAIWKSTGVVAELKLPLSNPFIPKTVALRPAELKEPYPVLLRAEPNLRIWYKQDDRFRLPKANIELKLASKLAYESAENAAMTKLFTLMLRDQLNEYSYPASLAGLHYSVSNTVAGLMMNISGYSENQYLLLSELVAEMEHFDPDVSKFEIFKNQIKESRQNQKLAQAYQQISYESYYLLTDPLWHTDDYLAVIDEITVEKLKQFVPRLLSHLQLEILVHGNMSIKETQAIGSLLEKHFIEPGLPPAEEVEERTMTIPLTPDYVYQLAVEDINSAVELYYQAGPKSTKQTVVLDMIQQIIEKPFYHQLRTIEQLGYLVWSGARVSNKVEGLYFIIQSGVKDPVYLQDRIEMFLAGFRQEIKRLKPEEFEAFREALIAKRMEEPKNLAEETFRFWSEITNQSFAFDQREAEIKMLKQLQYQEVASRFDELFNDPKSMRKISIQAFGKNHSIRKPQGQKIGDIKSFKNRMAFYPNLPGPINTRLLAN